LCDARDTQAWRGKAGLAREVGRNWRPISTCAASVHCAHQKPDAARAEAWLRSNPGYKLTDCTIYVKNVIAYAYKQVGDNAAADHLQAPKVGLSLFSFLVKEKGWTGIYWNPDVLRPSDGNPDHVDSYITVMRPPGHYRVEWRGTKIDVQVSADRVLNFKRTATRTAQPYRKRLADAGLADPAPTTHLFHALNRVRFGAVLGEAGRHLALLMSGVAYEVNYFAGPNERLLYSKKPFERWAAEWCSGIVVVPPGEWARAKGASP
jgi:hypothetical protein